MHSDQQDAVGIAEFCSRHGISRTTFYEIRKSGDGPREMRIGTRVLISRESAEEWRRRMETKSKVA